MELWNAYDIHRIPKDKTLVRGEPIEKGDYHLVVHVCVFNTQNQMLIQQRQPFKEGWPNLWDITCGGSAVKGETSQDAAHRELLEETGIDIDFQGVRPQLTINFDVGFDDVYLTEKEIDVSTLKLQYEEVRAAKWAGLEEILGMIDRGEFIPYFKSFITVLFETRKQYGCIRSGDQ